MKTLLFQGSESKTWFIPPVGLVKPGMEVLVPDEFVSPLLATGEFVEVEAVVSAPDNIKTEEDITAIHNA